MARTSSQATLALQGGTVLGWGQGGSCVLGAALRGVGTWQSYPTVVPNVPGGMSALSASHAHALAIGPGQVVWAWGCNRDGALGDGSLNPRYTADRVQR
jgi:alpha-tubulin suppressor-like RCC1 family protein